MQISTVLLALLTATLADSRSFFSSTEQQTLDDTYKVPGDNPLEFCADPSSYKLEVKNVDLIPNPPVPGKPLQVVADGTVLEQVDDGAKVFVSVKYNKYITLVSTNADLCENLPKIDIGCPLEKGDLSVDKSVDIPKPVPPGQYDVLAIIKDENEKELLCMKATVHFSIQG